MKNAIQTSFSLYLPDLTVPTSTAKYPLGWKATITDSSGYIATYVYIQAHAGLTAYQPYIIDHTGTDLKTLAPVTGAAQVVVPQVAFTSGYYGFALLEGNGKVLMTSETYVAGDWLQVLTTGTALVVDGTSGSTVQLVTSCGVCTEGGTTAVARGVYLLGLKADIAAT